MTSYSAYRACCHSCCHSYQVCAKDMSLQEVKQCLGVADRERLEKGKALVACQQEVRDLRDLLQCAELEKETREERVRSLEEKERGLERMLREKGGLLLDSFSSQKKNKQKAKRLVEKVYIYTRCISNLLHGCPLWLTPTFTVLALALADTS